MHIPDADVKYPQADGTGGIWKEAIPCRTPPSHTSLCPYYGGPELRVGFPQCCVEIQLDFDAVNAFRVRGSEVLCVDIQPFGERSEYFRPADGVTDAVAEVVPPAGGWHVP
jgi:hypothetical protein